MRKINNHLRRDKPVQIKVHPDFYKQFDLIRKKLESNMGNIPISQSETSKIILKGGLNIPKDIGDFFDDKRKKGRRY